MNLSFGHWLTHFRMRTGLSQRAFAAKIDMDCGNYNKYESGLLPPGTKIICMIAEEIGLNLAEEALLHALVALVRIRNKVTFEIETKGVR